MRARRSSASRSAPATSPLADVLSALGSWGQDSVESTVTLEARVPRTIVGLLAGAAPPAVAGRRGRGRGRPGRTIVAVLHDLNVACRYADHVVAMADGHVVAEGPPSEVVTAPLVEKVFGLPCVVVPDPVTGSPMVVPADDD